jgi:hypothetical protein
MPAKNWMFGCNRSLLFVQFCANSPNHKIKALISCVQHSPVAQLYSALVTLTNAPNSIADVSTRFKPSSLATITPAPITSLQNNDEQPINLPSTGNNVLTQGVLNCAPHSIQFKNPLKEALSVANAFVPALKNAN